MFARHEDSFRKLKSLEMFRPAKTTNFDNKYEDE